MRYYFHHTFSWRKKSSTAFCFLCFTLLLVSSSLGFSPQLLAQENSKIKKHDVKVGQLSQETLEASKKNVQNSKQEDGREPQTQAEVDTLFEEIIRGYRSACCTHQAMENPQCPCHIHQVYMLRFLILSGFQREEIDEFMVHGGPENLREDYRNWLRREKHIPENQLDEFMLRTRQGKPYPLKSGSAGPGWDQGWTELIHQSPRNPLLYVLLAGGAIFLLGTFIFGFYILMKKTKNTDQAPQANNKTSEADQEGLRKRIEEELQEVDEDS